MMNLDCFLAIGLLFLNIVAGKGDGSLPFMSLTAPAETIRNYEIHVPVVSHIRGSSDEHPRNFDVNISDYLIHLELNRGLIPPHFSSHHFDEDGNKVVEKGHVNCFYHGTVEGLPEWHVAMSTCHGLRGSFGEMGNRDQYYHIEPLDRTSTTLMQPHALYSANEISEKIGTCGVASDSSPHSIGHLPAHIDRNRVRRRIHGFYVVEWAIINDFEQFTSFGRNLSAILVRDLEIANTVDSLYRTLNVRVVIVHVTTWSAANMIPYPADNNPNTLLDSLREYEPQITAVHDSTMLMTGIDIMDNTVGIAFIGTMCRGSSSIGLTQDGGRRQLLSVASTASHELGHIFSMQHDDGRSCTCEDPTGDCIMSAVSGGTPPVEWSTCSRSDITAGFTEDNLNSCLVNEPLVTVGDPVCGNGIREGDEVCDCGTLQECTDPCCDASACVLNAGAQCSSGECCTEACQFIPLGTTCRPTSQECDITEFCTGDSSDCPRDMQRQDSSPCNSGNDYCFSGVCQILDNKCQKFFSSNNGFPACYSNLNVVGNGAGNCGYSGGQFVACDPEHVQCGQLQCRNGDFSRSGIAGSLTIFTRSVLVGSSFEVCRSFTTNPTSNMKNPGLVPDGTRCGSTSICVSQQCSMISALSFIQSCPVGSNGEMCSGAGLCNNLNQCSCNVGTEGVACETTATTTATTTPGDSTTAGDSTIAGGETIAAGGETTAAGGETTAAGGETTAAGDSTTAGASTTAGGNSTSDGNNLGGSSPDTSTVTAGCTGISGVMVGTIVALLGISFSFTA